MINPPGNLLKRTDWDLTTYIHLSSFCKSATFNIIITSEFLLYLIQSLREATKNGYFSGIFSKKKGGGSRIPKLNVKFWWPLFLALKTRLFLAKSDNKSPKCAYGGGEVAGLGLIPKFYHFFWWLP